MILNLDLIFDTGIHWSHHRKPWGLSQTFRDNAHQSAEITGLKHSYSHLRFGGFCKIAFSIAISEVNKHLQ